MFGFKYVDTKIQCLKWTPKRLKRSEQLCKESTAAKQLQEATLENDRVTSFNLASMHFNQSLYNQQNRALRQSTRLAIASIKREMPKTVHQKSAALAGAALAQMRNG